ncbi:hypothetical protein [Tsukamurella sp. 1534]|uniref:hypothetical protein n=1 Tax=Tsukamurella sp. 1534 TaxID=1151061 RepID=UPI0011D24B35|nr:hypothetical protein [Tsukamurella sp. 1534]
MSKLPRSSRQLFAGFAVAGAILAPMAAVAQAAPSPAPAPEFSAEYDAWSKSMVKCFNDNGITTPTYNKVDGWGAYDRTPDVQKVSEKCQSILGAPPKPFGK